MRADTEWPTFLESELQKFYKQELRVLQLGPLRKRDVEMAAEQCGVNAAIFLKKIQELNAAPFARKPFTLIALLRAFSRGDRLPNTHWDLYEKCCLIDCEEYNQSRVAAHKTSQFTPQQLIVVASRLAAMSVLTNRPELLYEAHPEAESFLTLQPSESTGGEEMSAGTPFQVTQDAVGQALETAMFAAAGPGRLRWETRSVAEFLTARYLLSHQLSLENILSLIVHPRDKRQRLVPQLHNTSVWLAERSADVFKHIVERQPDLLLLSLDPAALTDERRNALVEQLLAQASTLALSYRHGTRRLYARLKYPGISELLRRKLTDPNASIESRAMASEISLACGCTDLIDLFLHMALAPDTAKGLRSLATLYVAQLGDSVARGEMRTLLSNGTVSQWEDDELLGAVLMALWPDHLTFAELLGLKTPPKRPNTTGLYTLFVRNSISEKLPPEELPNALDWVEGTTPSGSWQADQECAAKLFVAGLQRISEPPIRRQLGDIAYMRLRAHQELIPFTGSTRSAELREALGKDDEIRRALVTEVLSRIEDASSGGWAFVLSSGMVWNGDLPWLLKLGRTTDSANVRHCCWRLALRVVACKTEDFEAIYSTAQEWPDLRQMASFILDPIDLDSQLARELRADHEAARRRDTNKLRQEQLNSALTSIQELLTRSQIDDWVDIAYMLESTGTERDPSGRLGPLSGSSGWMSLTTDQKDACLQAARRYVSAGDPRNDEWFGTTSWPYGAVAGYQALVILLQLDPEFVDSLGPEPWARWIPVLMTLLREGTGQYADDLVRRAYTANPSEFLKQLRARVRTEAKDSLYVSVVSNIEHVWDSAIESALCDVLEDKSLQGTAIGSLLRPLLYHKSAVALEFALSLLQGPASDRGKSEFAIAAAGVLIDVSPKEAWETLWPTLLEDDEFGKRIIEQTSYRNFGNTPLLTALTERELAQLFRWMLKQYPLRQNEGLGFGAVSPAFAATRLRDSLVQRLATYGSYEALEVLKTLQTELPNFPWVYYLAQADERAREATWQPPRPKDVVELARRSEARLVNNADQLMSVVKDALKRIQLQLRAETPAVEELWNHTLAKKGEKRRWTPKDELYLSNWLKRRLQEVIQVPGIMIGREVEIRSFVSSLGERTDLYIAAAKPGGKDKLVLVVEVKGCWHHELKTAMQTQLVERYLKENFYGHGIYVVGWFACALWDAGDYRRKDVGFSTSDEARAHLDQQAADLSNDEVRVAAFVLDATLR